ncbi:MAG: hypothetical protein DHS80DRAFT_31486 [Piptocephalis tieghemiana]|nr:MAG: hypothetical protein DHS80DRAFT_31486 [Piptocephalis tieghemiana]
MRSSIVAPIILVWAMTLTILQGQVSAAAIPPAQGSGAHASPQVHPGAPSPASSGSQKAGGATREDPRRPTVSTDPKLPGGSKSSPSPVPGESSSSLSNASTEPSTRVRLGGW